MWECQETPLPALPWFVPPSRRDGELVIVEGKIPCVVSTLWTICVIVLEWQDATDLVLPRRRRDIDHSSALMRS